MCTRRVPRVSRINLAGYYYIYTFFNSSWASFRLVVQPMRADSRIKERKIKIGCIRVQTHRVFGEDEIKNIVLADTWPIWSSFILKFFLRSSFPLYAIVPVPRTRDGIRLLSSFARLSHSKPSPRNAHGFMASVCARIVHAILPSYLFSNKFVRALMYYEKHVFSDNSVLTRETHREDSFSQFSRHRVDRRR